MCHCVWQHQHILTYVTVCMTSIINNTSLHTSQCVWHHQQHILTYVTLCMTSSSTTHPYIRHTMCHSSRVCRARRESVSKETEKSSDGTYSWRWRSRNPGGRYGASFHSVFAVTLPSLHHKLMMMMIMMMMMMMMMIIIIIIMMILYICYAPNPCRSMLVAQNTEGCIP